MKTRLILLLAISTLVTLSFTFVSFSHKASNSAKEGSEKSSLAHEEPAGGFISEDKL
jgi:hypothetical protein